MAQNLSHSSPGFLRRDEDNQDAGGKPEAAADDLLRQIPIERLTLDRGRKSKKLLVLDLNGLLAHAFFAGEKVKIPRSRRPDAVLGKKYVFKRPFCDEFLQFCFDRFEVGIWSSAMRKNVVGAISCVMGTLKDRLLFIWDQANCTDSGFKTVEKKHKPLFLKELKKLWEGMYKGRFSPSNTLLIDDSPYKALLNPPNTAIFPRPYMVEDVDDVSLGPDGEVRGFLEGLARAGEDEDVPSYVGSHPIGQAAITSTHSDWNFYSQLIRRFDATAASPMNSSTTSNNVTAAPAVSVLI